VIQYIIFLWNFDSITLERRGEIMEFFIAEEGVPINLGPDGGSIAYFGSEIDFQYETEAPHGDGIFSAKLPLLERTLPFWIYGRNLLFLDAYYLLAETVEKGSWSPICSMLINIHYGQYASLGQWYNSVIIEEKGIRLRNDFDGDSFFLENPKELQWNEI